MRQRRRPKRRTAASQNCTQQVKGNTQAQIVEMLLFSIQELDAQQAGIQAAAEAALEARSRVATLHAQLAERDGADGELRQVLKAYHFQLEFK